jgi:hypothetical protein
MGIVLLVEVVVEEESSANAFVTETESRQAADTDDIINLHIFFI